MSRVATGRSGYIGFNPETCHTLCLAESAEFNEPLAVLETLQNSVPLFLEHPQQEVSATIPEPYPQEPGRRDLGVERHEVFMLGNEHEIHFGGIGPNIRIGPISQPDIRHVQSFDPEVFGDKAGQCGRELIVDQELHADSRTE